MNLDNFEYRALNAANIQQLLMTAKCWWHFDKFSDLFII